MASSRTRGEPYRIFTYVHGCGVLVAEGPRFGSLEAALEWIRRSGYSGDYIITDEDKQELAWTSH